MVMHQYETHEGTKVPSYEGRRYSTFSDRRASSLDCSHESFRLQSLRYDDGRKANIMVEQCLPFLLAFSHGYPRVRASRVLMVFDVGIRGCAAAK